MTPMTAPEREMWLASHSAPEGYLLITRDEVAAITRSALTGDAELKGLRQVLSGVQLVLGCYFTEEPDLVNAAGACHHDAVRFKKGCELVRAGLEGLQDRSDRISDPVLRGEIVDRIEKCLAILDRQVALRRQRNL